MSNIGLFISHNVFITDSQRNSLISGERIEVIGVSVPTWVIISNGKSTEPSTEIFCEYIIESRTSKLSIKSKGNKYVINIPKIDTKYVPLEPLDFDLLAKLPKNERAAILNRRDDFLEKHPKIDTLDDLKSIKDGGKECVKFEVNSKGNLLKNKNEIVLVRHFVEVKMMEDLLKSLTVS